MGWCGEAGVQCAKRLGGGVSGEEEGRLRGLMGGLRHSRGNKHSRVRWLPGWRRWVGFA